MNINPKLTLWEQLLAVEKDRLAGRKGCSPDELEAYLNNIIDEVEREGSTPKRTRQP